VHHCVTVIDNVPVALSVESVPVMVTVPVVLPTVPVLPLVMLMMLESLDVNVVTLVLSVPLRVAVKVMVAPWLRARLIVVPKLEVIVREVEVDCPNVMVALPETTEPSLDCAAAWTVEVVPAGETFKAVTSPD
jgi:hypothetical protein